MSRATSSRLAAAACAAALALPAAAFVRSSDKNTGKELFWPTPVVPFHVSDARAEHAPSCAATASGYPALEVTRSAFSQWTQAGSNLELVFAGAVTEVATGIDGPHDNLVVFRKGFCSANPQALACMNAGTSGCGNAFDCFEDHTPGDRFIVALTSVLYEPNTGRIVNADIEVNGWNGVSGLPLTGGASGPANGWYFTCDRQPGQAQCTTYGQADCFYIDLQNTLTHEAGHFVGLSHPCGDPGLPSCASSASFAETTMFPQTTPGDLQKRTLSADDIAGVRAIYPDAGGGCGCGSGGAAGAIASALAVIALRPRRRTRR